jgi:hypothetical protein
MTMLEPSKDPKAAMANAEKALSLPIGVASPLWLMFAGAASAGVAYWWLARWRTMTNLEAQLAPAMGELPSPEPVVEAVIETVVEAALEPVPEAPVSGVIAEAVAEIIAAPSEVAEVIEAAAEPVVEPIAEPVITAAAEPILDVAPTPKPKAPSKPKAAAVRAAPRTTSGPTRR